MKVDTVAAAGEWIRHAPHRSNLLGRSVEPTNGRWQHGDVARALYLADSAETAVAEWYRLLAERGPPPGQAIPHDHHVWQTHIDVADLSTTHRLARWDSSRRDRDDEPGLTSGIHGNIYATYCR